MDVVELLRWAATCEAAGDEAGAITAYRQADELGDAEASVLLGQALRRGGYDQLAREAFSRGEARGHREAAGCLGNLLSDLRDVAGAREAYERSIRAGSTIAVLNLGLMLAHEGETEAALHYLAMARDNGDVEAFWAIGKLLQAKGELSAAADSYRGGAEAGDPNAAFGLGVVLHDSGDLQGSLAAFHRARDLGHEGAAQLIEVLAAGERTDGGDGESRQLDVRDLWSDVSALVTVIAEQRQLVGRRWIADQLVCDDQQARSAALTAAIDERSAQLSNVSSDFGMHPDLTKDQNSATLLPEDDPREWLSKDGPAAPWKLAPNQARVFDSDIQKARTSLSEARGKWLTAGLRAAGSDALSRFALRLDALKRARERARSEAQEAERVRDTNAADAGAAAARNIEVANNAAAASIQALPAVLQPWTSKKWEIWNPDDAEMGYRIAFGGYLKPKADAQIGWNAALGAGIRVPWGIPLHENWFVSSNATARGATSGFVRCPFTGAVNWCQRTAGSGGSQGFPVSASRMASSAVMPWAAAESR